MKIKKTKLRALIREAILVSKNELNLLDEGLIARMIEKVFVKWMTRKLTKDPEARQLMKSISNSSAELKKIDREIERLSKELERDISSKAGK